MNTDRPVNPEAKWIRLQEIGIVLLLAIPGSLLVITLAIGGTVEGVSGARLLNVFLLVALGLSMAGVTCIKYGYDQRRELHNKENKGIKE